MKGNIFQISLERLTLELTNYTINFKQQSYGIDESIERKIIQILLLHRRQFPTKNSHEQKPHKRKCVKPRTPSSGWKLKVFISLGYVFYITAMYQKKTPKIIQLEVLNTDTKIILSDMYEINNSNTYIQHKNYQSIQEILLSVQNICV